MAFWEDWEHRYIFCFYFPCWVVAEFLWLRQGCRRWRQRRGLRNEDIEFLKMELRSILAALRLVEVVPPEMLPEHLKRWATKSREASYDIQDILDTFLVRLKEPHLDSSERLLVRKAVGSSLRHSTWRKFADSIIDIKILLDEIGKDRAGYTDRFLAPDAIRLQEIWEERRSRYRADDNNPAASSVDPDLLHLIKDETRLVRPDGGMEDVIFRLSMDTEDTSNQQLKTVCILGDGELGKKTLARVYKKLQPQFDCSAFVSLSWYPNIRKVLRIILQQLDNGEHTSEATGRWGVRRLVDQLRQLLQNKRYIIAVDAICDIQSWQTIRNAMVDNNLRSRIITATRMSEVAEQVGGVYELRPISNDGDAVSIFRNILLHSYYQLPSHLRRCFLYISMFPEDSEFRRDRLVWRWIAEGFIEGKEGCSLFQIGQIYLDDLLKRSLIIEVDNSDGTAKYCHLHHMALDLAYSLARDENFVAKLVYEQKEVIYAPWEVRRLSLQNSLLGRRAHTLDRLQHVRSVAAFGTGINLMPPLSSFYILRVLDLEGCDLKGSNYNPGHLEKLLYLRYLGLRGTNVSLFARDIGNLKLLQILDLKGTRIRELPPTVVLLCKLLCLYAEPGTRLPKGMGNLTSLEELTEVSVSESPSIVEELTSFVELRVLDIVLQRDMSERSKKDFAESLTKLQKLQTLRISANSELDFMTEFWAPPPDFQRFVAVDGWFSKLPTWIRDATNLSELQIVVRELWREGLKSLGRLRKLRFLRLAIQRVVGERLAVDAGAFPNLIRLRLSAETCLVFSWGAMPKLQLLEFVLNMDKADGDFNWGLIYLRSLEKVTVKLLTGNSASANKEAEAALKHALESHPNHPKLELTVVTAHQEEDQQMESVDNAPQNIASSSEIQEERSVQ